ncbi:hypothetical protein ILUMI_02722 [Ignelater luminosus]|uniref:Uncharacterized protein n=1 Tax=Ignelater luminosus TaxID=2038154 RepID=A0A8K0DN81_IGNLU|nr:hypothetical protein ILUMI_02722 [Ignelater luminosus]
MSSLYLFIAFVCFGTTFAISGDYIPKSFYTIDENGHKSDLVYIRRSFLPRARRSASSGGASYGGGFAFDGDAAGGVQEIAGAVQSGLHQLKNLAGELSSRSAAAGGSGGGGSSFSGSFSSSGGGPGAGPVLHSRFAQGERELVTGGAGHVQASASASGPRGGVSYSSSSVDSDGQIHYNTHAQRF